MVSPTRNLNSRPFSCNESSKKQTCPLEVQTDPMIFPSQVSKIFKGHLALRHEARTLQLLSACCLRATEDVSSLRSPASIWISPALTSHTWEALHSGHTSLPTLFLCLQRRALSHSSQCHSELSLSPATPVAPAPWQAGCTQFHLS